MSKETDFRKHFNTMATMYTTTFGQISGAYARHILDILSSISASSTIHDNASGPGIVTTEILSRFPSTARPSIHATDFSEAMISGLKDSIASQGWQDSVQASVMDSESLAFEDDSFTCSITNFSLMIFPDGEKAAREIFRTLRPGGTAVVTTWKENGFIDLIHRTQKRIRPDLPELIIYDKEWTEASKLQRTLESAGFESRKIRIEAKEENSWPIETVMKLMIADFTAEARKGWSDEEKGRWNQTARDCLLESEKRAGTVRMVAWITVATK
jgi:ubiquinone/menaquinone biosynthesis C-methylase UbiE